MTRCKRRSAAFIVDDSVARWTSQLRRSVPLSAASSAQQIPLPPTVCLEIEQEESTRIELLSNP